MQDVGDGVPVGQELADVRHPGRGSRVDVVLAVAVHLVHEGVGQFLDDGVVAHVRLGGGAGARRRDDVCGRKGGADGGGAVQERVHDGGAGADDPLRKELIWLRQRGSGRAVSQRRGGV